ncbi:unnamed protein product [Aphanomyces euteiches]
MENSPLAALLDIFQVVLGIGMTLIYFSQNWSKFQDAPETVLLSNIQIVIGYFFTLDYCTRLYAADSRWTFFISSVSLIDLGTIVPQWLELLLGDNSGFKGQANALKTLRSLRFLRAFRLLSLTKTAKGRQTGFLFLTVMSIIFCSAGIIQALEKCSYDGQKKCQTLEIYNACYFVVITIATLGFGDIAPKSDNGKVAVIVLICITGVLLPLQISRLSDILNRETEYDKSFALDKAQHPHILICGDVNAGALDFFLRQFLHPDNFNWKDKVVILCPGLPSHNLRRILLTPDYEQRVMYLQGSAMLATDLKRAAAANARMCFVMLDKFSPDGDRNDTASNLLTISLRHHTEDVPVFVQVLKTDNIRHVLMSGASNILCIDELKMGILAKACVVPGYCALISNIIFTLRPQLSRSNLWASEFLEGCATVLCKARLPAYLDGSLTFAMLARILYKEFNMVLIATGGRQHYDVRLFPSRMVVRTFHKLFLLTTNPEDANKVDELSLSTLQKFEEFIPNFAKIVEMWNANSIALQIRKRIRSRTSVMSMVASSLISMNSSRMVTADLAKDDTKQRRHTGIITRVTPTDIHDDLLASDDVPPDNDKTALPSARLPTLHQLPQVPDSKGSASSKLPINSPPVRAADQLLQKLQSQASLVAKQPQPLPPLQSSESLPTDPTSEALEEKEEEKAPPVSRRQSSTNGFAHFVDKTVPSNLAGHVVLFGMSNKLHDFVAPLRHKHPTPPDFESSITAMADAPIVIVSLIPMTEKQYASIAMFDNIYYIHGSPLHDYILHEAQIFKAKSIVIMTTCMRTSTQHHDSEEATNVDVIDQNMIDTDAITLHRFVTEACESTIPVGDPRPSVVVVMSRPSSMRFLKDDLLRAEHEPVAKVLKVLTKRVLSRADDPLDNICHPLYAAGPCIFLSTSSFDMFVVFVGKVFILNSLDAVLGSCDRYGSTLDLIHLITFGEDDEKGTRVLDQIDIPVMYTDRPFGQFFIDMLEHQDMLCLGLYRARFKRHSYVYLNPTDEVIVRKGDKAFVIR